MRQRCGAESSADPGLGRGLLPSLRVVGIAYVAFLSVCVLFFQAEDGIRDYKVTGVQTCALPIFVGRPLVHSGRFGHLTTATALAYAVIDLLVLATLTRLLFATGRPTRAAGLFVAGVVALLAGDGGYCVTLAGGHPTDPARGSLLCWMGAAVLIGAAALHPAVPAIGRPNPASGTSTARVVTFVVLAVVDPVIGAAVELLSHRNVGAHAWADDLVPALLLMALSVLLVLRLGLLLRTVNSRAE